MYFDVSTRYQLNLQDSATYGMEMIVQLHNYVMLFNVFIITVVLWFFFEIISTSFFFRWLFYFNYKMSILKKLIIMERLFKYSYKHMLHMPILEVLWTLLPIIVLICIALPSLSMLYYFSLTFIPEVTIRVYGHQWFWSYEYVVSDNLFNILKYNYLLKNVDAAMGSYISAIIQELKYISRHFFFEIYKNDVCFCGNCCLQEINGLMDFKRFNKIMIRLVMNTDAINFYQYIGKRLLSKNVFNLGVDLTQHWYSVDSIMIQSSDLKYDTFRLLEVDNPLYLPIGRSIKIVLGSTDVLHSWAIPSLGIKVDCVPGRLNIVETKLSRSGIFYGQCSEICGNQHGFMPICVIAIPYAAYQLI